MVKFCFECGHKLEYKFSVPNFCPQCGAKIGGGEKAVATVKEPTKQAVKRSVESEDGFTNSQEVPKISKLEFEIENFGADVQHSIGSLFGKRAPTKRQTNIKNINDL